MRRGGEREKKKIHYLAMVGHSRELNLYAIISGAASRLRHRIVRVDSVVVDGEGVLSQGNTYVGMDSLRKLLSKSKDVRWVVCVDVQNGCWSCLAAYRIATNVACTSLEGMAVHRAYSKSEVYKLALAEVYQDANTAACHTVRLSLGLQEVARTLGSAAAAEMGFGTKDHMTKGPPVMEKIGKELEDYVHTIDTKVENIMKTLPEPSVITRPRITLRFRVVYENGLASLLVERRPRMLVFLSSDFCRKMSIYNMNSEEAVVDTGELVYTGRTLLPYVPDDVNINFHMYSDYLSPTDEWCGNQAGLARLRLRDVIDGLKQHGKFSTTLELRPAVKEDVLKGRITVKFESPAGVVLQDGLLERDVRNFGCEACKMGAKAADRRIMEYISDCYNTFKHRRPAWMPIKDIHAYVYICQAGILPAASYLLPYVVPSEETFYLNVLRQVLTRHNKSTKWFLSEASDQEVGRVVTEMACSYSNWCKYITDLIYFSKRGAFSTDTSVTEAKAVRHLLDSFDCVRTRGMDPDVYKVQDDPKDASDCEDFTKEILNFMHEIRIGRWTSPEMARIRENNKLWYNFAILGGVSSMALDGHYESADTVMNAHMHVVRIPCSQFFRWLRNGAPRHALHKLIPQEEQALGDGLKILVAEGTGLLYPDDMEDTTVEARRWLEEGHSKAFTGMRKRYTFHRDPEGRTNSFYQTETTMFTSDFPYKNFPYIEFTLTYPRGDGKTRGIEDGNTAGVRFLDFVASSPKIGIVPQSPMPEDVRVLVKHILKDQCPTPSFVPPTKDTQRHFMSNPIMKLAEESRGSEKVSVNKSRQHEVVYFVRTSLMTNEKVEQIKACIKEKGVTLKANPEPVTASGVGGYYLTFFVPVEKVY